VSVPRSEWERLTLEERVDKLRIGMLAQRALFNALVRALGAAGIDVRFTDEEPDERAGRPRRSGDGG
jgi:hypothetical protein